MTITQAVPGSYCQECHTKGITTDARRTVTHDDGTRRHLCLNHAAPIVHQFNIYDSVMNPMGKR